jgi:hypothetical protein
MRPIRSTWTDERLDDLAGRVCDGIHRLDDEQRRQRAEIETIRNERLAARFEAKQRVIVLTWGLAWILTIATLVAVIATAP